MTDVRDTFVQVAGSWSSGAWRLDGVDVVRVDSVETRRYRVLVTPHDARDMASGPPVVGNLESNVARWTATLGGDLARVDTFGRDQTISLVQWLDERSRWLIRVAGYGEFVVFGTEDEAEVARIAKARWERAIAHKWRIDHGGRIQPRTVRDRDGTERQSAHFVYPETPTPDINGHDAIALEVVSYLAGCRRPLDPRHRAYLTRCGCVPSSSFWTGFDAAADPAATIFDDLLAKTPYGLASAGYLARQILDDLLAVTPVADDPA